jgi:hypothetical protein
LVKEAVGCDVIGDCTSMGLRALWDAYFTWTIEAALRGTIFRFRSYFLANRFQYAELVHRQYQGCSHHCHPSSQPCSTPSSQLTPTSNPAFHPTNRILEPSQTATRAPTQDSESSPAAWVLGRLSVKNKLPQHSCR